MKKLKTSFLILAMIAGMTSCEKEDTLVHEIDGITEMNNQFNKGSDDGEPSGPVSIDCSVFKGIEEFKFGKTTFAGVKTLTIKDIDQDAVIWTLNGEQITPRNSKFIRLKDHISQPGTVEVCFEAFSPTCDVLSDCLTIDFEG
ncbi:hypothetical protein [Aquimarina sp. RZ0]|uniref:hypothetical protein n=1 Tax=Aquimarina sp. RZ0 TaxID=2607730 RepID=UPI0011F2F163|nr:hypothetical protein [Aquimarina sp. RZ0]KAA1246147.1 hypothetical protein F0000_09195 [Aquimarina sp. RZ0]